MKRILFCSILFISFFSSGALAQLGIKAGINMANEIKSLSSEAISAGFSTENLTGYQIGVVYQLNPAKSGIGTEIGFLVSQKGYSFSDSISIKDNIKIGYKEINYLEIPINLRYKLKLGFVGIFGYGGLYAGYALDGKIVTETDGTSKELEYQDYLNRIDYGYNLGMGVEFFKKIQFGINWSHGLKNTIKEDPADTENAKNRVFSVGLTYLF